ncbi:peptide/nickel transport system substrate-binding protein [Lachnospiraceae bacterium XBB1006]|nr:peptide/nickel transport system substrate-binding protein [Lachnospiraceae bacterium XBB1006]
MKNLRVRSLALLLGATLVLGSVGCQQTSKTVGQEKKQRPLVIGCEYLGEQFSPFTDTVRNSSEVVDLTQLYLMTTDRMGNLIKNGIEGEKSEYEGRNYRYFAPANVSVKYDENDKITTYTVKLREDLKFSDGEPVTADDVIFSYYAYLDPSYTGSRLLNSFHIVGLENYRMNSTAAEGINIEPNEVNALMKHPTKSMKARIKKFIRKILSEEYAWCKDVYLEKGYKSAEKMFLDYYNLKTNYRGTDAAKIVDEVAAQYGYNYQTLAIHYNGEEAYFDEQIQQMAYDELYSIAVKKANGEEVHNIEGIIRKDDYTVQIQTKGFEASAIYSILGIPITPLHYYGDVSKYDYEKNKFGFSRGKLNSVVEKKHAPLGAGPYVFKKSENGKIYLEANPYYYLGKPKIENLELVEVKETELVKKIRNKEVDVGEMSGSVSCFEDVRQVNANRELTGDVITSSLVDYKIYGYIGINADKVCIDSSPGSQASKALRKAFMTLFAVYRQTGVDEYYGEAATVLEYPIESSSWASPQETDKGYMPAFAVDGNGHAIYSEFMSVKEKYKAAKEVAKEYFIEAGYEYDEATDKFVSAPYGAKMEYAIYIPAEGKGIHPDYEILRNTQKALRSLGITLTINDVEDDNEMWNRLESGEIEMWCAAWESGVDPDMYQKYYSKNTGSNYYHIKDKSLDKLIMSARKSDDQEYRKTIYKECMDILRDWGVELPVYQRQNCTLFSTERIDLNSLPLNATAYYNWVNEIHLLEMN